MALRSKKNTNKCKATTNCGERCKNNAQKGKYCHVHNKNTQKGG